MTVTDRLLKATEHIWEEYHRHPFVKGIADGTLDKDKFKYYILQDYLYLIEYAKVFAVGIAKAKSFGMMQLFASYVHQLTDNEMNIHEGYMAKLNIAQDEVDNAKTSLDNCSYTAYMLKVAYEEGETEILAAILSCAYSYEVIAKRILEENPGAAENNFYGDWIKGYASDKYSRENTVLISTLEKLTENYGESQIKHLEDIFTICSKYELAFWNMAWNKYE